eukprot:m.125131 g.125131  ORF g.125131 m.125131 type:complete len:72 (-) comp12974_c0_seq7:28-243(-)
MVGLVTMVEMVTSTSLPMDTQLLCTSLLSAAQTLTVSIMRNKKRSWVDSLFLPPIVLREGMHFCIDLIESI